MQCIKYRATTTPNNIYPHISYSYNHLALLFIRLDAPEETQQLFHLSTPGPYGDIDGLHARFYVLKVIGYRTGIEELSGIGGIDTL